jgi:hypothetical protein
VFNLRFRAKQAEGFGKKALKVKNMHRKSHFSVLSEAFQAREYNAM